MNVLQPLQKYMFLIFATSDHLILSEILTFFLSTNDTHFKTNGELKGMYPSSISF